jgi:aminopeptidase-like protein
VARRYLVNSLLERVERFVVVRKVGEEGQVIVLPVGGLFQPEQQVVNPGLQLPIALVQRVAEHCQHGLHHSKLKSTYVSTNFTSDHHQPPATNHHSV